MLGGFAQAEQAIDDSDLVALAEARSTIWTALLKGSFGVVEISIEQGDVATARQWLLLREYRRATHFARPMPTARWLCSIWPPARLLRQVRWWLFAPTYLTAIRHASTKRYVVCQPPTARASPRAASNTRPLRGATSAYFPTPMKSSKARARWLRPMPRLSNWWQRPTVGMGCKMLGLLCRTFLAAFGPLPFTPQEQQRRAGQLLRYLSLVSVEYGRGIRDSQVALDLEITEAATFLEGALVAFTDLENAFEERDQAATTEIWAAHHTGRLHIRRRFTQSRGVARRGQRDRPTHTRLARRNHACEWQKHDSAADFDVISAVLDQMEQAVAGGQYDLAKVAAANLEEAYSGLEESGPEARLVVFAPELKVPIEDLFWFGQGENKGLAALIRDHATLSEIKATRAALDAQLLAASKVVGGTDEPVAVGTNAAIIVFREGLEAV